MKDCVDSTRRDEFLVLSASKVTLLYEENVGSRNCVAVDCNVKFLTRLCRSM